MKPFSTLNSFVRDHVGARFFIYATVLVGGRFWPLLFGNAVGIGDNLSLLVPGKLFTAHWLAQGVVPHWNPFILGGISWIGDINQSVLYPSTALFLFFSGGVALNILTLSHLLITGIGMLLVLQKLRLKPWQQVLGAGLWLVSPQMMATLNNISTLQSLAWMPWVVWAGVQVGERRFAPLLFTLFVFLQMWGGYPQYVLYSVVLAFIFNLSVSSTKSFSLATWLRRWVFLGLVTVGATTVLWLPFLETLRSSTRVLQTTTQAASGSITLLDLHKFILPYLFEHHHSGMAWGPAWTGEFTVTPFFGVFGVLVVSIWSFMKRKKNQDVVYASILLATTILALGDNLPGFSEGMQHIPILSASRGASSLFILTSFVFALWLPQLLVVCTIPKNWAKVVSWGGICTASGLLVLLAFVLYDFAPLWQFADSVLSQRLSMSPFHTIERDAIIMQAVLWFCSISAVLAATSIWLWTTRRWWLLTGVLIVEASIFSAQHIFFVPLEIYAQPVAAETAAAILPDQFQYRVLPQNYNAYHSLIRMWMQLSCENLPMQLS